MSLAVAELINVSKLEMVVGKHAELALVLAVVAALLITLLVVPACKILFPHFGKKIHNFKSIQLYYNNNKTTSLFLTLIYKYHTTCK